MSPVPTATPAARSSREKPASRPTNPASRVARPAVASATGGDLLQVGADQLQVVALLDPRAERVRRGRRREVIAAPLAAQEVQGPGPVDRLGHPRRLGQVQLAQAVDRRYPLAGP